MLIGCIISLVKRPRRNRVIIDVATGMSHTGIRAVFVSEGIAAVIQSLEYAYFKEFLFVVAGSPAGHNLLGMVRCKSCIHLCFYRVNNHSILDIKR